MSLICHTSLLNGGLLLHYLVYNTMVVRGCSFLLVFETALIEICVIAGI